MRAPFGAFLLLHFGVGLSEVGFCQNGLGCTCRNFFAGEQQGIGKVGADLFVIVQNGNDGVSAAMAFLQYVEKLIGCPCINGIERFVQKQEFGILNQHSGKKDALELSV